MVWGWSRLVLVIQRLITTRSFRLKWSSCWETVPRLTSLSDDQDSHRTDHDLCTVPCPYITTLYQRLLLVSHRLCWPLCGQAVPVGGSLRGFSWRPLSLLSLPQTLPPVRWPCRLQTCVWLRQSGLQRPVWDAPECLWTWAGHCGQVPWSLWWVMCYLINWKLGYRSH